MSRIITITSGKGGVGKTTITANIGTALALKGYKVCLIDADFGLRNLDVPLGLSNRIILDISDYSQKLCSFNHVLVRHRSMKNLHLVPGTKKQLSEMDTVSFMEMLKEINPLYDYILIDSPSGLESGFFHALNGADEAIIVTTPDKTALQDADRVIGILESQNNHHVSLLVNHYKNNQEVEDISQLLNIAFLGAIPADINIISANHKGNPIALNPTLQSGVMFRKIANNLSKHHYNQRFDLPSYNQNLFTHNKLKLSF
ncbi:septum site-determining protein MinD [Niallia sp.]|uniref:septum site-determining protein MinD n=1 Tax=Niallia sp. TaxID=2837523 RepID=UPI0028982F11|nr:septum site-determining protein MinD [Niallia sp.]